MIIINSPVKLDAGRRGTGKSIPGNAVAFTCRLASVQVSAHMPHPANTSTRELYSIPITITPNCVPYRLVRAIG